MLPSFLVTIFEPYWSEITLLGSMMASRMSGTENLLATVVRSGPIAPPSPSKRWQALQEAAWKRLRPTV